MPTMLQEPSVLAADIEKKNHDIHLHMSQGAKISQPFQSLLELILH